MLTIGRHLIAEFYDCEVSRLNCLESMRSMMVAAAEAIDATVIGETFHKFSPQGVSGTIVIAESHLSLHTWPERSYVAVDIYTCGGLNPRTGFDLIANRLQSKQTRVQEIVRGLAEDIEKGRSLLPSDVQIITENCELKVPDA